MREWWRRFFAPSRFPIDDMVSPADTEAELRALARLLPRPPARVLDVGCGTGRHSVGLARRGYAVVGVDQSRPFLALARRRAGRARIELRRADMRRLPFAREFDVALSLWSSFGYFRTEAQDEAALRSMRRALKPGGRLIIEMVNAGWLRREFQPQSWRQAGRGWMLQESRLERGRDPAVRTEWVRVAANGRARRTLTRVRLYDARRLGRALRSAGFAGLRFLPGLLEQRGLGSGRTGGRLRRLLVVARRDA